MNQYNTTKRYSSERGGISKKTIGFLATLFCTSLCGAQDTTFIFPMQEDHAKCYFMERFENGEVKHGLYENGDVLRINTGFVKEANGEITDTILYACDRVTKQWFPYNHSHKGSYENGMIQYCDYESIDTIYDFERYPTPSLYYKTYTKYNDNGFINYYINSYSYQGRSHIDREGKLHTSSYDTCGNLIEYKNNWHCGGKYEFDTFFVYTNSYDIAGNLIAVFGEGYWDAKDTSYTHTYTYDEKNRRLTEKRGVIAGISYYYEDHLDTSLTDKPYIICMKANDKLIEEFSPEKLEYDFTGKFKYEDLSPFYYFISQGATATESYDFTNNKLTITVKGTDYTSDTTDKIIYTLLLAPTEIVDPVLTSLTASDETINGFNPHVFSYECDNYFDKIGFTATEGTKTDCKYDRTNHIMTIIVSDSVYPIYNSYTIQLKSPARRLTSFTFHGEEKIDEFDNSYVYIDSYRYEEEYNLTIDEIIDTTAIEIKAEEDATILQGISFFEPNVLIINVFKEGYEFTFYNSYHIEFKAQFESIITSFTLCDVTYEINDFMNHFEDVTYQKDILEYEVSEAASIEEEFDSITAELTIIVRGADIETNPLNFHIYIFQFRPLGNGLPSVWGEAATLYVEGNIICIENVKVPIAIYDTMGRMIAKGNDERNRIAVPKAGIYLVEAAGETQKVMVKPF